MENTFIKLEMDNMPTIAEVILNRKLAGLAKKTPKIVITKDGDKFYYYLESESESSKAKLFSKDNFQDFYNLVTNEKV